MEACERCGGVAKSDLNISEPKVSLQQSQGSSIIGDNADAIAVIGGFSFFGGNVNATYNAVARPAAAQISCPTPKTCFAAAENDQIGFGYRTTDGGETWEVILSEPGISMVSVHAVSEDQVYFAGQKCDFLSHTGM
jgi:hypothetical protein